MPEPRVLVHAGGDGVGEQVMASDGGRAVAGSGFTAMLTYTHRF